MTRLTFTLLSILTIALLVAGAFWLSQEACIADAVANLEADPVHKAAVWWRSRASAMGALLCAAGACGAIFGGSFILCHDPMNLFRKPTP